MFYNNFKGVAEVLQVDLILKCRCCYFRKLYWFEVFERLDSRLYVSDLDGSNQKIIVNITGEPNGLVIDYNDSRIYWVAKNTHRIESIDLDGRNRRLIARSLGTPVELAVFKNRLYFCEQERPHEVAPSISSVIKYDGTKKIVLKSESGVWFQDITVHHTSLQIGRNIVLFRQKHFYSA